jgi:hypothetical protein
MGQRVQAALEVADPSALQAQLATLEQDAGAAGLWDDAPRAQALMARINGLRAELQALRGFQGLLEEAAFAVELLEAEVGACIGLGAARWLERVRGGWASLAGRLAGLTGTACRRG